MKDFNSTRSLVDPYNRAITYLRVSLTQRCNLKCSYCFGSTDNGRDASELSNGEIIQLIKSFALLGINKIRFTGGEPLLRRGVVNLVRETKAIEGIEIVGLTTNGFLLDSFIGDLVDAGLDNVNISIDSLKAATFHKITGVNAFARVMAGMDMSLDTF